MPSAEPKEIFLDALELPAEQRDEFVCRACGMDQSLLAKVRSLLATHRQAGEFLKRPAVVDAAAVVPVRAPLHEEQPGDVIDRYRLERQLGEGGFGVVFLARQTHPVQRQVALKVIKRGMDSRQVVERFELERQTLAVMDHPNIARVFDAGTTPTGRPYFVMEYVGGAPINAYCDQRKLGIRARLELVEKVCLAVQHAHTKGVIHRDLKPGNILVTEIDGRPEPKVIDFGVAKATDSDLSSGPAVTHEFQIVGTPQYMSPEQATTGSARNVDTRSDVYSLGTILYELMAGAPPFEPESLRRAGLEKVCQIIREVTPPRPSTRVARPLPGSQIAQTHGVGPQQLRRRLAGEVDWIVMKALEKEPQRRYQSAAEFAADIRRHLDNEAVLAGPPSFTYQLRKFARRHRLPIAAAGIVILALASTAVIATVMASRARQAEAVARANEIKAQTELSRASAISRFTDALLEGVKPAVARGRDTTLLREILQRAIDELPERLGNEPIPNLVIRQMAAESFYALGDSKTALSILEPAYMALENTSDRDYIERLRAGVIMSILLEEDGQDERSERVIRETIAGFERTGQGKAESAMAARVALAGVLKKRNRHADAQKVLTEVVRIYREAGEEERETALVAANNLAMSLRQANKIDEAIEVWKRLIEIQRRTLGDDHPYTLGTMNNLAASYNAIGRQAEAEAMYRQQLAEERRIYQPGHPSLVKTLTNLGALLVNREKVADGEALLREAETTSAGLEPKHPVRVSLAVQLIKLCEVQGRWEVAVERSAALHQVYLDQYGPNDRRSATCVSFRVRALTKAGRYEEAVKLLAETPAEAVGQMTREQQQSHHAAAGALYLALGQVERAAEAARLAESFITPDSAGRVKRSPTLVELQRNLVARGVATQPAGQD